jgi:hypothetical protein
MKFSFTLVPKNLDILKEKNASINCMYMRNYTICNLVPVGMVVYNCEQRFLNLTSE